MTCSVCIATFNGGKYIYQQLESIRRQTMKPDEVIICDDCSTDDTSVIIKSFIREYSLTDTWHFIMNSCNKGYPANFYYALSQCNGDYIFLSDQDDIWDQDKICKMYRIISSNPTMDVLSSQYGVIDETGKSINNIMTPFGIQNHRIIKIPFNKIFYKYNWPGMTMVIRNSFFHAIYSAKLDKLPHDLVFACLAAEKDSFFVFNYVGSYHRRHSNNLALEEHKIGKLLKRTRKISEIESYNRLLQELIMSDIFDMKESREYVKKRLTLSSRRLIYIKSRKVAHTIILYIKNIKELRIKSLICDLVLELL